MACKRCGRDYPFDPMKDYCPYCGQKQHILCEGCGRLIEWDPEEGRCPFCYTWYDDDRDAYRVPVRGKTQRCDCCGHIMQAFWQDMTTGCGNCGAEYVNNGSCFVLVKPGKCDK